MYTLVLVLLKLCITYNSHCFGILASVLLRVTPGIPRVTQTGRSPLCAAGEREPRASTGCKSLTTVRVRLCLSFTCLPLTTTVPYLHYELSPAHASLSVLLSFSLCPAVSFLLEEPAWPLGSLKHWKLTLYGSSLSFEEVKERQRSGDTSLLKQQPALI